MARTFRAPSPRPTRSEGLVRHDLCGSIERFLLTRSAACTLRETRLSLERVSSTVSTARVSFAPIGFPFKQSCISRRPSRSSSRPALFGLKQLSVVGESAMELQGLFLAAGTVEFRRVCAFSPFR